MTVAICIATYRRPAMLAALLRSLAGVRITAGVNVRVIVTDNDAEHSAATVVSGLAAELPWPVEVVHEPQRNIALARNRGVAVALAAGVDCVAFIDDDERATPHWLEELLRVHGDSGADVVTGPVINDFPSGTPEWIASSSVLARPRHPDGMQVTVAETSNALVTRTLLERIEGPFDPSFGRTGGSDSHFFLRARLSGARITWASGAVVHETMPASRTTIDWMVRRAFRVGNSAVLVARAALPVWRWLPRRLAAAGYRVALGASLLVSVLVRGRAALLPALQNLSLALGALAGIAGIRYVEYERSHGE